MKLSISKFHTEFQRSEKIIAILAKSQHHARIFQKTIQNALRKGEQASTTETTVPSQESTGPDQAPEEKKPSGNGAMQLELKRSSYGKHDTLGKLFINGEFAALSIESPKSDCLETGSYKLSLRTEGGRHASYWYRFGDKHKGMLYLESGKEDVYSYICLGNYGRDANGSILMGTTFENEKEEDAKRAALHSESAYLKIYPQITAELEKGQELKLVIS